MKYTKEIVLAFGLIDAGFQNEYSLPLFVIACAFYLINLTIDAVVAYLASKHTTDLVMQEILNLRALVMAEHSSFAAKLESSTNELQDCKSKIKLIEMAQSTVQKMAEESKKMISQANLGMAFRGAKRDA